MGDLPPPQNMADLERSDANAPSNAESFGDTDSDDASQASEDSRSEGQITDDGESEPSDAESLGDSDSDESADDEDEDSEDDEDDEDDDSVESASEEDPLDTLDRCERILEEKIAAKRQRRE